MNILVVYDSTGYIITQMSGDIREPQGIPFMRVEIPQGKRLVSIDTTKNPHEPVFEDFEPTEIELIKQDIQTINDKMLMSEELNYTAMEAVVSIYEAVLPFLPR